MRSGKLVHIIAVLRATTTVNDTGTPVRTWAQVAVLRAELLERATEDFLHNAGEISTARTAFRTRFLADVLNTDRINFDGQHFEIEEITRIGRQKGLEIRCRQVTEEARS